MAPSAIVYTSHTGFTARYAGMLARASGIPSYDLASGEQPPAGTSILFLGWLCAGRIRGLAKARRRWSVQAVCAVGMAEYKPENTAKLIQDNNLGEHPFFYLRGGYAPERLRGIYRLMMAPMTRSVLRAPAETQEQRALQEAFRSGGSWMSEEQLSSVLDWLDQQR